MKFNKTKLFGSVFYLDLGKELPTSFEGYEFTHKGEKYFIPSKPLEFQSSKYNVMNLSSTGVLHQLSDTMCYGETLKEVERMIKYIL